MKIQSTGYPRHRENGENGQKKIPVRENTGNLVKTQGKHRDFLKVKDIVIFAAKKNHFFPRSWIGLPSRFCVCNSHKLWKLAQGKFAVGKGKHRENTGNLKIQFEWVPCLVILVW